jgi:hypothetical protein
MPRATLSSRASSSVASLIRIAGVIAAWKKGDKHGLSLWPDAVRVIKLSQAFNATIAFGPPEDGFDGTNHPVR